MSTEPRKVVTRFAPSPTGFLHAGAYRTAIFSYLFARHHKGTFVLRIEDTDKLRSKKEYEENIIDSLGWLGLEYDVFVRQSENMERHKALLLQLIAEEKAYISKEEAKDGSGTMREIVRFKNPNIDVTFTDEIKGDITMSTSDLGDFVIAKNINEPLFHLAVVVDDFDEGVTHVIRGEDHVSNTPRQILIQRAIGAPTPIYAHLPLVLGIDKQKLSKRRGAPALTEYREKGYLPGAILNMVTLVGWNPGTTEELFSKTNLIEKFSLDRVQKSAAVFNPEKLDWVNKEYIKLMSPDARLAHLSSFMPEEITTLPHYQEMLGKIAPLLFERISHFAQIRELASTDDIQYFFLTPTYDKKNLFWKNETDTGKLRTRLSEVHNLLSSVDEVAYTHANLKSVVWDYAEKEGRGAVLWPTRYALSGREKSPDPFQLAEILGKAETLRRLEAAIALYHE